MSGALNLHTLERHRFAVVHELARLLALEDRLSVGRLLNVVMVVYKHQILVLLL